MWDALEVLARRDGGAGAVDHVTLPVLALMYRVWMFALPGSRLEISGLPYSVD